MLISIIIPVYNTEIYLKRCIESVINQSYKNIEILLINDGSTDNSRNICEEYANIDKRIKVINTKNNGVAEARNIGISLANGDLIGFVDSDDYVKLDMFEKLFNLMYKNNCDMAICGYLIEDENNKIIKFENDNKEKNIFNNEQAMKTLVNNGNFTSFPWDKLYKKKLFEGVKYPKGKIYEDADTTYKLIHKCEKIVYSSEPLYHYLQRKESISHCFKKEMLYRLEIDINITEFIRINYPNLFDDVKPIWYRTNIQLLISMYLSKYDDDNLYKKLVKNIKPSIIFILKDKKLINSKEKIIAIMSCLSYNFTKILIYNISKIRNVNLIKDRYKWIK